MGVDILTLRSLASGDPIATSPRVDDALAVGLDATIVHQSVLDDFELLDRSGAGLVQLDAPGRVVGWTPDRVYVSTEDGRIVAID